MRPAKLRFARAKEIKMGRTRFRFGDSEKPHFLTATVVEWLPVFARPEIVDIVVQSIRFAREQRGVRVFAYVIMEHHMHMVAGAENLPELFQRFKSYTARQAIDTLTKMKHPAAERMRWVKKSHKRETKSQFWQEGHRPRALECKEEMQRAVDYVHMNPVKRGYVDLPEQWRYSSARDYAGTPGLVEVDFWT